ncbi:MAG: sulfatase-like hydrolase/transferase, partial [Thermodesulfobacteriota bacterium]
MSTRTRLEVVALLALSLLAGAAAHAAPQEARPNVVLILGDDHGWPYSGFMGDPYVRTPHLDALAAGGTVFDNAHATASTCVPSLRAVLGGVHPVQWDREIAALEARIGPFGLRQGVTHVRTLPRELARHGYVSWEGGKMWEGTFAQAGFTHGLATAPGTAYTNVGQGFGRDGFLDGTALDPLRAFLDEAGERPFFVWFAPMLPHAPFDAPDALRAPYVELGLSATETAYYANVSWLDALVGELVDELAARGLRENTLLLYLADNGWGVTQLVAGVGRGKGTLYELGFRTPLILNWPGRVPAGVVRHDLVSALDVLPTILEYAGAAALADRAGVSLVDAVETGAPVGRDRIVGYYAGAGSHRGHVVRTPAWRYIAFADGREELYAITTDPYEHLDVAAEHPDVLAELRADVATWRAALDRAPEALDAAGRLTDFVGAALGGVELQLRGRTAAGAPLRLRVLTSPRGDFLFPAVPRGGYRLSAARGARRLRWGPFSNRIPLDLPVHALGSYTPLAALGDRGLVPGTATVHGVVRDDGGAPLAGATVTLRGRAARPVLVVVRTDAQGRYRAEHLPAAAYRVTLDAGRAFQRTTQPLVLGDGADVVADLTAA